jgi:hypothetical protein
MRSELSRLKRPLLFVMAPSYVAAGLLHFIERMSVQLIPPGLPAALAPYNPNNPVEFAGGHSVYLPPA